VARLAHPNRVRGAGGRVNQALGTDVLERALAERTRANSTFFEAEAERLARLCHRMAERFARNGRLIALGLSPAARSDARHVAVEFVHPVIVGKRALPALALSAEGGPLERQVRLLVEPDDMAIAFGDAAAGVEAARGLGCLTIAFERMGAEWEFEPPSEDASIRQELVETLYHVLWELVHVFFDHRGLLEGREARQLHDPGASSFLYPFLSEQETDLGAVVDDVRRSVLAKAREVGELRAQTLSENAAVLGAAAESLRASLNGGGRLLALGNGGSATDAMDVVADFRSPPDPRWTPRPALDLTEDAAILTALANDIGTEAIFSRQVIAHGRSGDTLLAISTSGNSANVIAALEEARRRGLGTVAMVGYDGGRVASERLAEHVIVTRSEHIPRIQEAQASAYHVLRELVA
jgi:D-sedoheptulose 7-phosphate isomerase